MPELKVSSTFGVSLKLSIQWSMYKYNREVKWGIIFSIVSMGWMFFERTMGWHSVQIDQHATMTMLFLLPAVATYVLALLDIRSDYKEGYSWKQGFRSGMIMTATIVLLSPLNQMVTHYFISPSYFENITAYSVEKGLLPEKEALAYFTLSNYIVQSALFSLIAGTVISAIVAIFTRKKG